MSARILQKRHRIEVIIKATSPLHVGGMDAEGVAVDMALARNGAGEIIIPGTSLAGALRDCLALDAAGKALWGGDSGGDGGASLISVSDAVVCKESSVAEEPATDAVAYKEPLVEIRPHTSIDRYTGTAASGRLFDTEVIPTGTCFKFTLTGEVFDETNPDDVNAMLEKILYKLHAGIDLGASTNTGLGRICLDEKPEWKVDNFETPDGLLAALFSDDSTAIDTDKWQPSQSVGDLTSSPVPPETIRITIPWIPKGAVMSKRDDPGGICESWPTTTRCDGGYKLLLPGSAIRGALRTRAEHIARMILGRDSLIKEDQTAHDLAAKVQASKEASESEPESCGSTEHDFLEQMKTSARWNGGLGLGALFGEAGDDSGEESSGRKGALRTQDILSKAVIPKAEWEALQAIPKPKDPKNKDAREEAEGEFSKKVRCLNKKLKEKESSLWFSYVIRNAIDRWSGSVSEGAVYSSLEPYAANGESPWEDIVLEIDLGRLIHNCNTSSLTKSSTPKGPTALRFSLGIILLTLKDLAEGWVPLGFGSGRGLGAIEVKSAEVKIEINSSYSDDALCKLRYLGINQPDEETKSGKTSPKSQESGKTSTDPTKQNKVSTREETNLSEVFGDKGTALRNLLTHAFRTFKEWNSQSKQPTPDESGPVETPESKEAEND